MDFKQNNILLISSPTASQSLKTHMPPLGLAYLATSLREAGFQNIEILDLMLYDNYKEKLIEKLKELNPVICGVTFVTPNRFQGFEICRIIKENSRATVVVGGPHVSFTEEDTLSNIKDIDIICRGEGEKTFTNIVKTLFESGELEEVNGISFRDKSGKIISNKNSEPMSLEEISSLIPAYDLLELAKYKVEIPKHEDLNTITIITQRGCPHGCNYCSTTRFWGLTIRPRKIKDVVDEIEMLHKKYNYNGFYIFDDCFTFFKERTIEFCRELKRRRLDIKWSCSGRVNNLDEELVRTMVDAGCVFISLGVESASQRLLNQMHKGIRVEQVKESKRLCEKYGLNKKYWFIFGHPTEIRTELRQTVKLINRLNPELTARSLMKIYPGTEIEGIAKKEGILPADFSWSKPYKCPRARVLTSEKDPNIYYAPNTLKLEDLKDAVYSPLFFSGDFLNPLIVFKKLRKTTFGGAINSLKRHFKWYFRKR